ncbi:MAG TPA: hypothetical protein VML55_19940, partial [Planctomycetaceae bacterium]|nr:hypothetical protein [Planctomycetaceae bacterium]
TEQEIAEATEVNFAEIDRPSRALNMNVRSENRGFLLLQSQPVGVDPMKATRCWLLRANVANLPSAVRLSIEKTQNVVVFLRQDTIG